MYAIAAFRTSRKAIHCPLSRALLPSATCPCRECLFLLSSTLFHMAIPFHFAAAAFSSIFSGYETQETAFMPIYEFYCSKCHAIFNFFARSISTTKQPDCPKCGRPKLEKQVSAFSAIGNATEDDGTDDLPISEDKMERAMMQLAGEAESISEDDPRQEAQLMRRFSELTGIEYGDAMSEAIKRLEGGEDMESIEAEMGELLDGEDDPFMMPDKAGPKGKRGAPARDNTLYDL